MKKTILTVSGFEDVLKADYIEAENDTSREEMIKDWEFVESKDSEIEEALRIVLEL